MIKKLPYDEIERLVYAFQGGDSEALATLISYYDDYLLRMVQVLKDEYYDCRDRKMHTSRFRPQDRVQFYLLSLFMPPKQAKLARIFWKSKRATAAIGQTLRRVRRLFWYTSSEDIHQHLRYLFTMLAARHKKDKFSSYVSKILPLRAKRSMREWIDDATLIYMTESEMAELGLEHHDEYDLEEKSSTPYIRTTDFSDIDENWINGLNCGELFEPFSRYERRILKLRYEYNVARIDRMPPDVRKGWMTRLRRSDSKVGDILGCSRQKVNYDKNAVISDLAKRASAQRLLKA